MSAPGMSEGTLISVKVQSLPDGPDTLQNSHLDLAKFNSGDEFELKNGDVFWANKNA
jgi:hypothetical protein